MVLKKRSVERIDRFVNRFLDREESATPQWIVCNPLALVGGCNEIQKIGVERLGRFNVDPEARKIIPPCHCGDRNLSIMGQ